MFGKLFGSASSGSGSSQSAAAQNMVMLDTRIAQMKAAASGISGAVSHEAGQYLGVDIRISKAENGFIVSVEGRRFIAESVEDVTGIIAVQMIAMESQ